MPLREFVDQGPHLSILLRSNSAGSHKTAAALICSISFSGSPCRERPGGNSSSSSRGRMPRSRRRSAVPRAVGWSAQWWQGARHSVTGWPAQTRLRSQTLMFASESCRGSRMADISEQTMTSARIAALERFPAECQPNRRRCEGYSCKIEHYTTSNDCC